LASFDDIAGKDMTYRDIHAGSLSAMVLVLLAAGCGTSGNQAQVSDHEELATAQQIEGDPDRVVCRRQQDTGSRLASRVCKTAREWEQERIDNQDAMRNATKSPQPPSSLPTAGGG
jgi:hypothetical protein